MSAGDIVAALPHVKCAQTRKRGGGRRSEQPSHRQTGAAAAVLLLWAAALLPAPAAALNTFSIFAKKKEVSRCGHEHDEDEYSYATARIASVKAQVRCHCPAASGHRVNDRAARLGYSHSSKAEVTARLARCLAAFQFLHSAAVIKQLLSWACRLTLMP